MVEHELHIGREIDEGGHAARLMRQGAEIEGKPAAADAPDVFAEQCAFGHLIGHDMQHAAKPLDERIGLLPLAIGGEALVFWPARDDRSGNQAAFAHGNGADMIRFGLHNGGINIDLHMQRPGDATAPGLAGIGLVEEIMIEIRRLGKPRVVQRRPVDDVQMGYR